MSAPGQNFPNLLQLILQLGPQALLNSGALPQLSLPHPPPLATAHIPPLPQLPPVQQFAPVSRKKRARSSSDVDDRPFKKSKKNKPDSEGKKRGAHKGGRSYSESAMAAALLAVRKDGMSVNAAAKKNGVPEATLRWRIKNGAPDDGTFHKVGHKMLTEVCDFIDICSA